MSTDQSLFADIDSQRRDNGFLTLSDTMKLAERGNRILDPFSTLISAHARIGSDNLFHPNVTIIAAHEGAVTIGNGNSFHAMTYLEASDSQTTSGCGKIEIGSQNIFGPEGGQTIKANTSGSKITIGNHGRYLSGVSIMGTTTLGDGSQILGPITVQNCTLEAGAPYTGSDPELRAAVIKGTGQIRNQDIKRGQVAVVGSTETGVTLFDQSHFHPKGSKSHNS